MAPKIAILVLAAGNSSRFGGCKLLAQFKEKPLISYALEAAKKLSANNVYLITGAWHEALVKQAEYTGLLDSVNVIHHHQWQQGMGSSIAKGIKHLASNFDAVMIMLADQPLITLAQYRQIIAQLKLGLADEQDISSSVYAGKRGVPAIFKHTCFAQLATLDADQGAKALLYEQKYQTVECELAAGAIDIDLQEQLNTLNSAT